MWHAAFRGYFLAYEWVHDGRPQGTVRVEVGGNEAIGRLVVTQTVPAALAGLRPRLLAAWHARLEALIAELHGAGSDTSPEREDALLTQYRRKI